VGAGAGGTAQARKGVSGGADGEGGGVGLLHAEVGGGEGLGGHVVLISCGRCVAVRF